MCLLCVRMPGEKVNPEYLFNANSNNPDGSGFAILRSDLSGIDVFCSMDGDVAAAKYIEAVERDPECWSMYHARFSTHGTRTVDNVHPFKVGNSKKTVLAHNGILPVSVPRNSNRSDTRIFAENILPSMGLGVLDDKYDFDSLERWCAGSKIAIFSLDSRLKNNIYIINEELGTWEGGTWWSNNGYQYCFSRYVGNFDRVHGTPTATVENVSDVICPICESFVDEYAIEMDLCQYCLACFECSEHVDHCMCHVPARNQMSIPNY